MKLLILFGNVKKMLLSSVLVTILFFSSDFVAQAQPDYPNIPHVPVLSLTGNELYNVNYYPDGRLWVPPTSGEPREFLMPIFVLNRWYNYYYQSNQNIKYIANPIKSFEFSILYNGKTLRAIGVETEAPEYFMLRDNEPLAKHFAFDVQDTQDSSYWRYLNPDKWSQISFREKYDGRRLRITAASSKELPHSSGIEVNRPDWQILCFVRFRVQATVKEGQSEQFNRKTPVYIEPTEIKYNNVNVVTERPTELMSDYDFTLANVNYPQPEPALAGVRNDNIVDQNPDPYNIEPYKPGTIFVNVFDRLPEFDFETERMGDIFVEQEVGQYNYNLPLLVDSNSTDPGYANAIFKLINNVTGTRLSYIEIDSDREWLQFRTIAKGDASKDFIDLTRSYLYRDYVTNNFYIDNDILGTQKFDPLGAETFADRDVWLEVLAQPTALNINANREGDAEKAGRYEGSLTFKSPFAGINPIKLNFTFWYLRNPYEPSFQKQAGNPGGINLSMINSKSEEIDLIFGTAHRATPGVDFLLGENSYNGGLSTTQFDARFFPVEEPYITAIPNGFADITPNTDNPRTRSRDIRNYNKEGGSYQFMVKFNAPIDEYPIIVRWNTDDFPQDASLFIRDSYQGIYFPAANMRLTTQDPEEDNVRYFVISNPNLDRFVIEYTLPTDQEFVGYFDEPLINRGWNLLSLPLRPENLKWDNIYTEAINIPYFFSQNQYQDVEDGTLKVGRGYFVKYTEFTEETFQGTRINKIDPLIDPIRVYPTDRTDVRETDGGWNLIGSITTPVTADYICFEPYQGEIPDALFTSEFGVWAYQTSRGYFEVTTLLPGLGYWIKTNANGYLRIDPNSPPCARGPKLSGSIKDDVLSRSSVVNISDNAQHEYTLYTTNDDKVDSKLFELPPVPSEGYFDIRYTDNTYLNNSHENVIRMQGVDYPIVINIDNADADYTFTDAVTGEELGSITKGSSANLVIENTTNDMIKVAKINTGAPVFGIETYPNPVVSSANFDFTITENTNVSLALYDALGNEVATIINNKLMSAGSYIESFDAVNLGTGSYIVKFSAGSKVRTEKLNVVK